MKIKEIKEIREKIGATHLVVYAVIDGELLVATHGETTKQAVEAAEAGNKLKEVLGFSKAQCISKPLERICSNCEKWQKDYHRPGDIIEENFKGKCMNEPKAIIRYEKDRACISFVPKY